MRVPACVYTTTRAHMRAWMFNTLRVHDACVRVHLRVLSLDKPGGGLFSALFGWAIYLFSY